MAPRLKVFVTSDGLTDFVVAATSKVKALAAWGSHQDLFKSGLARETDDPELVGAAQAAPGQVLRRPAGTRGDLARLKAPRVGKTRAPSAAARKRVEAMEKKLAATEAAFERAQATLEAKRAAVEDELLRLDERRAAELGRLKDELEPAKAALQART